MCLAQDAVCLSVCRSVGRSVGRYFNPSVVLQKCPTLFKAVCFPDNVGTAVLKVGL